MTTSTPTTYTISVPPVFWADHAARCVERDVQIAKGKSGRIVIELTGDEIADLHSDADYYSCPDGLDPDCMGLVRSARATLKAIEQQVDIAPLRAQWVQNQKAELALWKAQQ